MIYRDIILLIYLRIYCYLRDFVRTNEIMNVTHLFLENLMYLCNKRQD